jgi:hypothetical protein
MTMPASIIVPMAIAMPPSDMMFALMPWWNITMNETRIPSGRRRMTTSALRKCTRNTKQIRATMRPCWRSFSRRLSTARSMSGARS